MLLWCMHMRLCSHMWFAALFQDCMEQHCGCTAVGCCRSLVGVCCPWLAGCTASHKWHTRWNTYEKSRLLLCQQPLTPKLHWRCTFTTSVRLNRKEGTSRPPQKNKLDRSHTYKTDVSVLLKCLS